MVATCAPGTCCSRHVMYDRCNLAATVVWSDREAPGLDERRDCRGACRRAQAEQAWCQEPCCSRRWHAGRCPWMLKRHREEGGGGYTVGLAGVSSGPAQASSARRSTKIRASFRGHRTAASPTPAAAVSPAVGAAACCAAPPAQPPAQRTCRCTTVRPQAAASVVSSAGATSCKDHSSSRTHCSCAPSAAAAAAPPT